MCKTFFLCVFVVYVPVTISKTKSADRFFFIVKSLRTKIIYIAIPNVDN